MTRIDDLVTTSAERTTQSFDWGEIEWMDNHDLTGCNTLTFGKVTIYPGEKNSEHFHSNCDEALYLLSGTLEHTIGDEKVTLTDGDLIHIPRGERHQATNPGEEEAIAVIAYDTGEREFELTGRD